MKPIIIKELREQFKVALLGLAVLAVMLVLAVQSSSEQTVRAAFSQGYNSGDGLQPLLSKSVLIQVAFFCAIFGALLGWLQIRAESHPDLWAFLVHRPIPRRTILRGKVVSGLLLYTAAAGLPLLGLVAIVSTPGRVAAPFEWAMALPLTAIFFSGIVYYFAGLLTGLRKARWFASRGFGLGLGVAASVALFTVPEFWHALLILAGSAGILVLAVSGSFQTGGYYQTQPWHGKLALTLASLVSASFLVALACALLASAISPQRHYSWSQYQLIKDGRMVKITQHQEGGGLDEADIVDLSGIPLLDEKTGRKMKAKELSPRYANGLSATVDFGDQPLKPRQIRQNYSEATRFFSPWRVLEKTIWYLTADGRLVAYHGITRRLVGILNSPGSAGAGAADDARFLRPQDYSWGYLRDYTQPEVLASARTAYLVDLEKISLKPLFTATNDDSIGAFSSGSWNSVSPLHDLALIVTRQSIQLLNLEGKSLLRVPFEPAAPSYPSVSVYPFDLTNGYAVRWEPDYLLNKAAGGKFPSQVKWLQADGTVRQSMTLPKLPPPQQEGWAERLLVPLVPPAVPFYAWDEPGPIWHWLRLGPALVCALLGWWFGRRNNLSRKANFGWGLFHLLFGVPGLLAFLAVQEWPPKESCPSCKKLRAVDRERCQHCGASFPPPAKNGTEIFEPLTAHWNSLAKP